MTPPQTSTPEELATYAQETEPFGIHIQEAGRHITALEHALTWELWDSAASISRDTLCELLQALGVLQAVTPPALLSAAHTLALYGAGKSIEGVSALQTCARARDTGHAAEALARCYEGGAAIGSASDLLALAAWASFPPLSKTYREAF